MPCAPYGIPKSTSSRGGEINQVSSLKYASIIYPLLVKTRQLSSVDLNLLQALYASVLIPREQ